MADVPDPSMLPATDPEGPPPTLRRVHHLGCGTFCPVGGRLVNAHGRLVCHCLLVELPDGLVLVDTGIGESAVLDPARLTAPFRAAARPQLALEETAAWQIEKLGFSRADVRHIVLTHLDFDHAGGLADFPAARVHLLDEELRAALAPRGLRERGRYHGRDWGHDVKWQPHAVRGERWYGFECVRDLPGLPPELLLVPLPGHSRGHCGVAVEVGGRWLLHCGDAYFHKDEVDLERPRCPPALALLQRLEAADDGLRRHNQERLRELARGVGGGICLFSAHDPDDLARLQGESTLPTSSPV